MAGTFLLLHLAGAVALLLWGTHLVSASVLRGFGTPLRQWLGQHLNKRWSAFAAGLGLTTLLQSSTATGLMATSFTASGVLGLEPALAVMLGANVGTTIVAQLLAFDVAAVAPVIILLGVAASRAGRDSWLEDVGSAIVGVGLMILALGLLSQTLHTVETSAVLKIVLETLGNDYVMALLVAAVLTWACHSSVAVVLLITSLGAAGMLSSPAAPALVLGANLGGAMPPLVSAGPRAARRLPLGNLLVRAAGCAVALPLLPVFADRLAALTGSARLAVDFHAMLNIVLAILAIGLTGPLARLLTRLLPEDETPVDPGTPRHLDPAGLDLTNVGLANAAREAMRATDLLAIMVEYVHDQFTRPSAAGHSELRRLDSALDRLCAAIRTYLADIGQDGLSDDDADRLQEILAFVINLEHVGDIVANSLGPLSMIYMNSSGAASFAERDVLDTFHLQIRESLTLAIAAFLHRDLAAARQLTTRKEMIRGLEAEATGSHFQRARETKLAPVPGGDLFLRAIRDFRRIHHHIAAMSFPIAEHRDAGVRPEAPGPADSLLAEMDGDPDFFPLSIDAERV